jgi:hypothetical protein
VTLRFYHSSIRLWDRLSDFFVGNCVPCLASISNSASVIAEFPECDFASQRYKLIISDVTVDAFVADASTLRASSFFDLLTAPEGLEAFGYERLGTVTHGRRKSPKRLAALLNRMDLSVSSLALEQALAAPWRRPACISRARTFFKVVRRGAPVYRACYAEEFGSADDFNAFVSIALDGNGGHQVGFHEATVTFETNSTGEYQSLPCDDFSSIRDRMRRLGLDVSVEDVEAILG